jgi:hypothetical protein
MYVRLLAKAVPLGVRNSRMPENAGIVCTRRTAVGRRDIQCEREIDIDVEKMIPEPGLVATVQTA